VWDVCAAWFAGDILACRFPAPGRRVPAQRVSLARPRARGRSTIVLVPARRCARTPLPSVGRRVRAERGPLGCPEPGSSHRPCCGWVAWSAVRELIVESTHTRKDRPAGGALSERPTVPRAPVAPADRLRHSGHDERHLPVWQARPMCPRWRTRNVTSRSGIRARSVSAAAPWLFAGGSGTRRAVLPSSRASDGRAGPSGARGSGSRGRGGP
jgi:hypothetical protein